jgi:hypothetical protein
VCGAFAGVRYVFGGRILGVIVPPLQLLVPAFD